ncbi:hypothetical protein ACOMHN_061222 [Nucella lapillus]
MALKLTIAFLFCSLVLGSVFGETVVNCDSGDDVCASANNTVSYGDGTTMCCSDGYSMKTGVDFLNGVTTRSCTCTQSDVNTQVNAINQDVKNIWQEANQDWQQAFQDRYRLIQAMINNMGK